jgi:hypothetical protein
MLKFEIEFSHPEVHETFRSELDNLRINIIRATGLWSCRVWSPQTVVLVSSSILKLFDIGITSRLSTDEVKTPTMIQSSMGIAVNIKHIR